MKSQELSELPKSLLEPDFKTVEPHLISLDKHLTLRSYVEGYSFSELDKAIWVTIRTNKVALAFVKKGAFANLVRWFTFIEESHPEIQEEIKAKDEEEKAKKAALSKAGANYDMALQDVEKGVVTRFPPEPSYVFQSLLEECLLNGNQWVPTHWTSQSCTAERLLRTHALQGHVTSAI
jgi:glutamyl-tRNA synthetase